MKILVYPVYDQKIERYANPFFMQTQGQALRAWLDATSDTSTQFAKHPADYTLFEIGTYDDETGQFTNHVTPISKGTALEFQQAARKENK